MPRQKTAATREKVIGIRLDPDEYAALLNIAKRGSYYGQTLAPGTLAREIILTHIREDERRNKKPRKKGA